FQAEDGIRGFHVTGVQTCALPISWSMTRPARPSSRSRFLRPRSMSTEDERFVGRVRSFIRRGGTACTFASALERDEVNRWAWSKIGRASCRERGKVALYDVIDVEI